MSTICTNNPPCVPIPGECVYYSGNPLTGPNIQSGDNFNTVITKINNYINTLGVNVTGINLGVSGPVIYAGKVGNTFQYKRILAGNNVTIDETGEALTINATDLGVEGDGGIVSINGLLGLSQSLLTGTSGTDFNISSTGSSHVFNLPIASSINSGKLVSSDWNLFNSKISNAVSLGFGEAVYKQQVGVTLQFKSINVSGGLSISSNGDEILISAAGVGGGGEVATMTNLGSVGGRIYSAKIGTEFQLRRVAAGTGMSVTENATQVVVTNLAPDIPIVLNAGANINVSGTYPNFTISAVDTGEVNTMQNLGGGLGIYSTKIGTEFKMRTLVPGAGITMAIVGDTIEIGSGVGGADGNNYPTTLSLSAGTLTLGRFGLSNLTTSVNTDQITEGTSNLFYTNTRVFNSLTGGTGISINTSTGAITNTGIVTADNGLTKTGNNVQLGGSLLQNTTITVGSTYDYIVTSTRAGSLFTKKIENTGTGIALFASSESNAAVSALSTNGSALYGKSINGFGITAISDISAADLQVNNGVTNGIVNVLQLSKFTTGTAAIGHGVSMTFGAETSSGTADVGLTLGMSWTNITAGTRTSSMTLTLVDNAANKVFMRGLGSGQMVLSQYGVNTFTGTPTYGLAVDATGKIIEVALGGAAAVYTANNGLTMTSNNTKLGGTLIENTSIDTATYNMSILGSSGSAILSLLNYTGTGLSVLSNQTGGNAAVFSSSGANIVANHIGAANTGIHTVFQAQYSGASTGGVGLGLKHTYDLQTTSASTSRTVGEMIYKWTNATTGAETGQFIITLANNGIFTADKLTLSGNGALRLHGYGSGSITGTPFRQLAVDSSGNVIEIAISGGGSELTTASNGLNLVGYDVKLGGTLTGATTIATGATYSLAITGSGNIIFSVTTSAGQAASFTGTTIGGSFAGSVLPLWAINNTSSNVGQVNALTMSRTAAIVNNGAGIYQSYNLANSTSASIEAATENIVWTSNTNTAESAEYRLRLIHNGAISTKLSIFGTGAARLHNYGINTFTGTAAYYLAVDASGNIIEVTPPTGGSEATTASNGLTITGVDVKLGGTLTANTTIAAGAFNLLISGNSTNFTVNSSGAQASAFTSSAGGGIAASFTASNLPAWLINSSNAGGIERAFVATRSGVTGAVGVGLSSQYDALNASNSAMSLGAIQFAWTNATASSETADFQVKLRNLNVESTRLTLSGNGSLRLHTYGVGARTGSLAYVLGVDSSGNVIETTLGSDLFVEKATIGTATNWIAANDNANGFLINEALKIGDAADNFKRTITLNTVFFVTQANFTGTGAWVQCGLISNSAYRPSHTMYFKGSSQIDATKYKNAGGITFTGNATYGDMNIRIDPNGQIFVYITSISSYPQLSGVNIVVVPINITYFLTPSS